MGIAIHAVSNHDEHHLISATGCFHSTVNRSGPGTHARQHLVTPLTSGGADQARRPACDRQLAPPSGSQSQAQAMAAYEGSL
jgi:hypothetical protein